MAAAQYTSLSLVFLIISFSCITSSSSNSLYRHMVARSRSRAFIKAQCRSTLYPRLCVQCLSNSLVNVTSEDPTQVLAQVALSVSLVRARYASAYIENVASYFNKTRAGEYQTVSECLYQINDSVDQLAQSVKELREIKEQDKEENFVWHTSNVKTWVSAALTDAMTCMDGFAGRAMGGKVRATIKAKVLNVAQVTSNALALFNGFAAKHRPRGAHTKP